MKPSRIKLSTAILFATLGICVGIHHKHYHRAPIIDLNGAEELIGVIREDERAVTVTPHLHILKGTGPVCRYELTPVEGTKELPFESRILDNAQGTAQIHLREGAEIDCSDVEYRMRVVAVRCSDESARSEPVTLKVSIQDVNNHAPEFDAPWYTFDVEEGKTLEITRLFATDKDCGHPYGKICRYELSNPPPDSPFRIDDQGVLSLIKPLNRSQAESHILTVVAYDCGMLRSKSTLVTVHVKPRCVDGIRQTAELKEPLLVTQAERSKRPLVGAELAICVNSCDVKSAEVEVRLKNDQIDSSVSAKRSRCGLSLEAIDLLNSNAVGDASDADNDEDDFDEDELPEKSTSVYEFDGKSTSVIVSSEAVKNVIPEKFTLQFSMQMQSGSLEEQKTKQNILCETDLNGLNRHHFAVYVRHCKLELLLRREPENAEAEFRSAEWRWSDGRVCDGNWHDYSILFADQYNVQLMIDGEPFNATETNPEILDDWPLHKHKDTKTRLVVGACWHGRAQKMVQFFKGQLSSLYLLTNKVESEQNIKCLHGSEETLRISSPEKVESVELSKDKKQLKIRSNTLDGISSLLQSIEYSNSAVKMEPGTRTIHVTGHVTCQKDGDATKKFNRTIAAFQRDVEVRGVEPPKFSISISGKSTVNSDRKSLKIGAILLPDVEITLGPSEEAKNQKLDWCTVHMNPPRDMDLEFYSSPATLMSALNVDFSHDKQGIMLKGKETADNYAKILMKIHYFNTRPESYHKRMYKLQCGKGNVTSNELSVTMEIDATEEFKEAVKKLASITQKLEEHGNSETTTSVEIETNTSNEEELGRMVKHFEPTFDQLNSNRLQNILEMDLPRPKALHSYDTGQTAIAGGAVAIIVVICIGMLLVLLIVGVVKMRDDPFLRRRRSRRDSFEWDDNGLNMNVTVNPLEGMEKNSAGILPITTMYNHVDEANGDESCSEDGESYRDETDDEDNEVLPLKENGRQGLEWDDDGELDCPGHENAKSYRV